MVDEKLQEDMEKSTTGKEKSDLRENKIWAVLCYLGILVIIPLIVKKDSEFCRFHAKQGLILLIGWVLSWFPVFGWVLGILVFILSIVGIINILEGLKKPLPFVGHLADNLNI